jgi:site-specific recombinase XerD
VEPFTAARRSSHARRDEAILLFLFDTGARASEFCGLKMSDLDLSAHRATVLGKGRKTRLLFFGRVTAKAIWQYLRETPRESHEALFRPDRGCHAGERFSPAGLLHFFKRLGKAAGIHSVRCSPHTARHTFAVTFLRNGGNVFTLQQMPGHTSLAMTRRYVVLAEADMEAQHREYSLMDSMDALKIGERSY